MAYWILQANPDVYRIFDALEDAEAIRTWTVAHHRQVIAPGDEFALWASGPKGGVCAFGVVTEPAQFKPDDLDPYWEGPAERNEPEWLIGIKVTDQIKPPIPRSEIAADPALASMPIIRMPGGGNPFPVNEAQWQAIRSHRRRQLDTGQDDDASGWPDGEIQPTLTAYFAMLRAELAGQSYVKAAFNREVQGAQRDDREALWSSSSRTSALFSGRSVFHTFWATSHVSISRVRCVLRWSDSLPATRSSRAFSKRCPHLTCRQRWSSWRLIRR